VKRAPLTEDLSVLGRRGELQASELRRLDMVLAASPVDRWLHEVGSDFDQISTEASGDAALLGRVVERAATPRSAGSGRIHRGVVIAGIAAGCFASFAAAAVALPRWLDASRTAPANGCAQCPSGPAAVAAAPTHAPSMDVAPPAPAPTTSSPSVEPSAAKSGASQSAQPASAAEQFARANALRKSGRLSAAIAAYRQLQRSQAQSPQARLSYVLLGRILLRQGAADAAHEQFTRYLRSGSDGTLAEDALYGKAMALRMSGRTAEERVVHAQLIARFPSSIHARASRARLRELD
jgi:TolA-binding protein